MVAVQVADVNGLQNPGAASSNSIETFSPVDRESEDQSPLNSEVIVPETAVETITESKEEEPVQAENFESAARLSCQSGNDEAAWQTLIDMIELRHKNDVADLQEEHELEVAGRNQDIERLENDLRRANRKRGRTQLRVDELLQSHTELQAEVDASKEALQQAVSASQALQAQYDELKEKYENCSVHDNALQIPPTQSGEQGTIAECPLHEHENLEQDLNQLRQAFHTMAADLNKALDENRLRANEVYELKRALEQHPEHDIGLQKVIEYKDKWLEELRATAAQCSSDLDKLQKDSAQNKDLADGVISRLQARIAEKTSIIARLQYSKNEYKEVSESILAMLQKKAYRDDLIQAMESHFQTVRSDNYVLAAGNMELQKQIDEMSDEISTLQADLLQAKISSDEKDDQCEQIQRDMCEKENEVGALQIKTERLEYDLEQAMGEKERCLAMAENGLTEVTAEMKKLMDGTVDERTRAYLRIKEQETENSKARYRQLQDHNNELQQRLDELGQQAESQTCLIYYNGARHDLVEARCRDAEEAVTALRNENQLLQKLPPTINITKVLEDREELERARERIQSLEEAIPQINITKVLNDQVELGKAREKIQSLERVIREEKQRSGNGGQKKAVEAIIALKLAGFQMLLQIDKMNKANKAGERGDDFGDVTNFINECQDFLDGIDSFDMEDEGEGKDEKELDLGEEKEPEAPKEEENDVDEPKAAEKAEEPEEPGTEDAARLEESDISFF